MIEHYEKNHNVSRNLSGMSVTNQMTSQLRSISQEDSRFIDRRDFDVLGTAGKQQ
jgi:hypothetical protein